MFRVLVSLGIAIELVRRITDITAPSSLLVSTVHLLLGQMIF